MKIETEAELEAPLTDLIEAQTEEEKLDALMGDEALKVEFDQAVKAAGEERAKTPFLAAAQTHAMVWTGFQQSVSELTSADLKRIIIYLTGYPFYMKELGTENKKALAVAFRASKLVEAKSAMILCKAIEQEARVAQALDEQEALIEPLDPANFVGHEVSTEDAVLTSEIIEEAVQNELNKGE